MASTILILDLDGVLITNPLWKADEIDPDGYSAFNKKAVANLNELLVKTEIEIWLSSTRRTVKTLDEFNVIFEHRGIKCPIHSFLPIYPNCSNRKEEILAFLTEYNPSKYIILDDDKSLHELEKDIKERLVHTELMKGFTKEKLKEAMLKLSL